MLEKAFSRFASAASRWAGKSNGHRSSNRRGRGVGFVRTGFRLFRCWQLAINTGTTIITFLIVFLIQKSQNRDTKALQIRSRSTSRQIPGPR